MVNIIIINIKTRTLGWIKPLSVTIQWVEDSTSLENIAHTLNKIKSLVNHMFRPVLSEMLP